MMGGVESCNHPHPMQAKNENLKKMEERPLINADSDVIQGDTNKQYYCK
jgi:hypothetical protein